jgi:DNA polymerase III subunit delta
VCHGQRTPAGLSVELVASQLRQRLEQIDSHCFLVHGAETLLVEETRSLLRQHFASRGFSDVNRLSAEGGFDWSALEHSTRSLSLFAERRYIELRLPSGKPGDGGTAFIEHFARDPGADTVLVVVCGKLDKKALAAGWCRSMAQHGVIVDAGSVQAARLPEWIRQRLAELGVVCAADVAARLAYYVEGNLLAADQEVRKLALLLPAGATLDEERLTSVMADHARFSVFAFVDACVAGQAERCLRILRSLRREGAEPVVMVWALAREVRRTLNLLG